MKGKYLITTDQWFYAPDGLKYRSVWGDVKIIQDSELGIQTNRNSTNWYAFVGNEEKGMVVAGCQIHYAVKCENKPNTGNVTEFDVAELIKRPTEIYLGQ